MILRIFVAYVMALYIIIIRIPGISGNNQRYVAIDHRLNNGIKGVVQGLLRDLVRLCSRGQRCSL
jgi:hypothetical protein